VAKFTKNSDLVSHLQQVQYDTNSSVLLNDLAGINEGRKEGKCRDLMYSLKTD